MKTGTSVTGSTRRGSRGRGSSRRWPRSHAAIPQRRLMRGNAIAGRPHEEQHASLLEGAKRAGDLAAEAKLTMIVEPLNSLVNHKGFFLTTCTEGLKLIDRKSTR